MLTVRLPCSLPAPLQRALAGLPALPAAAALVPGPLLAQHPR